MCPVEGVLEPGGLWPGRHGRVPCEAGQGSVSVDGCPSAWGRWGLAPMGFLIPTGQVQESAACTGLLRSPQSERGCLWVLETKPPTSPSFVGSCRRMSSQGGAPRSLRRIVQGFMVLSVGQGTGSCPQGAPVSYQPTWLDCPTRRHMYLCLPPRSPQEASSPLGARSLPPPAGPWSLLHSVQCGVPQHSQGQKLMWEQGVQPGLSVCLWGAGGNRSPLSVVTSCPYSCVQREASSISSVLWF